MIDKYCCHTKEYHTTNDSHKGVIGGSPCPFQLPYPKHRRHPPISRRRHRVPIKSNCRNLQVHRSVSMSATNSLESGEEIVCGGIYSFILLPSPLRYFFFLPSSLSKNYIFFVMRKTEQEKNLKERQLNYGDEILRSWWRWNSCVGQHLLGGVSSFFSELSSECLHISCFLNLQFKRHFLKLIRLHTDCNRWIDFTFRKDTLRLYCDSFFPPASYLRLRGSQGSAAVFRKGHLCQQTIRLAPSFIHSSMVSNSLQYRIQNIKGCKGERPGGESVTTATNHHYMPLPIGREWEGKSFHG
ncbi:hypothetical protein CEXT_33561 [Caerostris extrusa]|uniref:Maturase K n=1 Tax=Caerostris extrusa TaxID=172846 RepID=A0AAV4PQC0_CAEEX|nr:hypothetical protein CEXT_33561 [Caerostris extrusa]